MNTATLVPNVKLDMRGNANLYKLSPAIEYSDYDYDAEKEETKTTEYVVVSTANVMFSGIETYMFPSDSEGEITDWGELPGSQRGTSSHSEVLNNAGYTLI